uniref:kinase/pyrophosphorylase n=1 Tax=Vibrio vulnificus TaxID=672 RepID=UPI0005017F12
MQTEKQSRDEFYVSDGRALTCETLGHVVLGHFPFLSNEKTFPFVESEEKLTELIKHIGISFQTNGIQPLVFFSLVLSDLKARLMESPAYCYYVLESIVQR